MDNNKIKKMTSMKIAYSIYEDQKHMKQIKKKKLIMSLTICLLLIGSVVSVDAATGHKISNHIKNQVAIILGQDGQELKGETYVDKNGDTWVKVKDGNSESQYNKSELEKNNLKIQQKETQDDVHIEFNNQ